MAKARGVNENEDGTSRQALKKVVRRHAAYAANQKWIDEMFRKYDEDNSGFFEQKEVRTLLEELSPDGVVTDADVAYIWGQCDPDNDGKISRGELVPLAATWNTVALKNANTRASQADDDEELRALAKRAGLDDDRKPMSKTSNDSEAPATAKSKACAIL
tara:strand:- start:109 stop:588 length:480 start_codon:yes stop_codon:yes gene_type:complete